MLRRILILTFAFLIALNIDAGRAWLAVAMREGSSDREPSQPLNLSTSQPVLPNSCELVATEALRRMERAHVWSRILIVRYADKNEGHALCVYQPHWQIVAYDDTGSVELETNSHDPNVIAAHLAKRRGRPIKSAKFLR